MAELAVNQYGETFVVSQEATHWMVRRMADALRGGPLPTFDADGRPIVIPIDTTLTQFHEILRSHGCTPGKYRLDPVDQAGRPIKGTPAYLPFPPGRKAAPVTRGDEVAPIASTERPRNGNMPSTPVATSTAAWSTGGAFPLPVPMHLTGAEYLFGEQMRAHMNIQSFQVQAQSIQAQAQAQVIVQLAGQMGGLMSAAAELLRAADGASLPRRKPMAEREAPAPRMPQLIVQRVAPPMEYDEPDDDDGEDEPEPPKPPAWTDKIGDVFTELAPMAKVMLQNKLADLVAGGGGGDVGGLGAILGGMMPGAANTEPRNAAPLAAPVAEPAAPEEPEIDPTPEALAHLGRVIERLSGEHAGRALRDELRLMDSDARVAFALDLLELPIDDACEEAVAKVAGIRVRRTRAMIAAERARGGSVSTPEYDGADLVSYDPSADASDDANDVQATTDEPVTYDETTEEPSDATPTPGYAHVRTTTGPTGLRVSHYRPLDGTQAAPRSTSSARAAQAAPRATATASAAPTAGSVAGLAAMIHAIQDGRDAALGNLINSFPGGASGIEASLAQLPPDVAAQLSTAIAATTAGATTTALAAPVTPSAPVTVQAAMARMTEISAHLSPEEMATAQLIAARLPASKRGLLMAKLVAVPLAEAVAIVKDILATHAAHGNPVR